MLKFGSNGEGNGQFNAPTGVAVDSNGNIIVADWGNSRIQVHQLFSGACQQGGLKVPILEPRMLLLLVKSLNRR
jgi:DNA-binding beta-propeller fold protein YncE